MGLFVVFSAARSDLENCIEEGEGILSLFRGVRFSFMLLFTQKKFARRGLEVACGGVCLS